MNKAAELKLINTKKNNYNNQPHSTVNETTYKIKDKFYAFRSDKKPKAMNKYIYFFESFTLLLL